MGGDLSPNTSIYEANHQYTVNKISQIEEQT